MTMWLYSIASRLHLLLLMPRKGYLLLRSFRLMARMNSALASKKSRSYLTFASAVVLAKAQRLLLGTYDMIMSGLDQDAGALLRPAVESFELLQYLREDDPRRVRQLFAGRLPSPGKRAAMIKSDLKPLRDYLNEFASHVNVSGLPRMTPAEVRTVNLRIKSTFDVHTLRKSIDSLLVFVTKTNHEVVKVLELSGNLDLKTLKEYKRIYLGVLRSRGIEMNFPSR